MEVFKIEFTVIIVFCLTAIAISKELEIYRTRLPGKDGWRIGRDSFKIPPSLCNQGIKCGKFSALTERQCFCKCPDVDATFLLDNNDWRCSKNQRVQRLLGYDSSNYILFDAERLDNPLRMIDINDRKRISLSPGFLNCQVDVGSSWYIGCSGFTSFSTLFSNNTNLFTIEPDGDPLDRPPYFLEVNSGVANSTLLAGRVIKLGIVCSGSINRWLLFKFVGNFKCPMTTGAKVEEKVEQTYPPVEEGATNPTQALTPPTPAADPKSNVTTLSLGLIVGVTVAFLLIVLLVGAIIHRQLNARNHPRTISEGQASQSDLEFQSREQSDGYETISSSRSPIYASIYEVPNSGPEEQNENLRPPCEASNAGGQENTGQDEEEPFYNTVDELFSDSSERNEEYLYPVILERPAGNSGPFSEEESLYITIIP